MAFLARSLNPNSLPGYLNVIRILHLSAGLPNPLEGNWEINMLKRAFSRTKGVPPVQKLPITVAMLRKIREFLSFTSPADLCFWAALVLGFYGFLRKSTLLLPTCSTPPHMGIRRSDAVNITVSSLDLIIRRSKTIQFGQRILTLPYAACADSPLCPVRALLFHLYASPLPADTSLFSYLSPAGAVTLSQGAFAKRLKSLLSQAGYNATQYSAHSLRRGGTTFAINSGMCPLIVKARGDWSSNAFERYVYLSEKSTLAAAQLLSSSVANSSA